MIRSTKHFLNNSNYNKKKIINDFLADYKSVTQMYIDYIWNNTFTNQNNDVCWDIKNDKLFLPKYLDYKIISHYKLSARALSAALTQAIGIVRGSTTIRNKTLYIIKKRKEEGKSTEYWEKKLINQKISKPIIKDNFKAELSSKQVEFRSESKYFDSFLKLSSTGYDVIKIPIKHHKQDKKWLNKSGKQLNRNITF